MVEQLAIGERRACLYAGLSRTRYRKLSQMTARGFNVTQLVFGEDGHAAESNMQEHFELTANSLMR